jgi:hypothetical protein
MRIKDERVPKEALKDYIKRRRPVGNPRGRWLDAADRDGKRVLKCRNGRQSAEDRDAWRWRIEQAKAQVVLWCHRRGIGVLGGKFVFLMLCPLQIPHGLAWDQTQPST